MTRRAARQRVAVLISGRGSNMAALIEAARAPDYPAEIALVVSNVADARGLDTARAAGVSTAILEHAPFGTDRGAYERTLVDLLSRHRIECVCLAGFMRLLTPLFIGAFENRILNIHPALLPAFKGLRTHERALAAGVKIHGATVHVVVAETDSGPIVAQGAVPVHEDDDAASLSARVLAVEHRIYPLALALFAAGRVQVIDGRCRIDGAAAPVGRLLAPQA